MSIQNTDANTRINLLDVDLDVTGEKCMICQDTLSCATIYKLPECGHEYHTHCVVAWFRNGDSRCPYCGNKGINHKETDSQRIRRRYFCYRENEFKISELRKFSKTKDAPKLLVKRFAELDALNKTLSDKLDGQKKFLERIKVTLTNFKEVEKERKSWRNKIFNTRQSIQNKKLSIANMHIVPLIIPIPVDVNF